MVYFVTHREVQNQTVTKLKTKKNNVYKGNVYFKNKCVCSSTWPKVNYENKFMGKDIFS